MPNTGVSLGRKMASKRVDDASEAVSDGKKMSSLKASLLADQAPLPPPPATDTSTATLSTYSTNVAPRSLPYPRKISLVPQRPLPPYLINPEKSAAPLKDAEYASNNLSTPDFGTAVGAVPLSDSSNTTKAAVNHTTTTSFANATADVASSPATKSKGDGDVLSLSVHEGTPAHDALQANAAIRVRRMQKVARKLQVPQVLRAVKKTGSSVINPNLIHKGKKPPRIPVLNDSIEAIEHDYLHQQDDLKSPSSSADSVADDGRHRRMSKPLEQEEVKFLIDSEVINNSTSNQNTISPTQQSTHKEAARVDANELGGAMDDEGPIAALTPETTIKITSIQSEVEEDHQHGETSIPEVVNDTTVSTPSISQRPTFSHRRAKTEGNLSTTTSKTHSKRSSSTRRLLFPQSTSKSQPKEENETIKKSHRKQRHEKLKKKKEKDARKSYVKGKVIDRKHELYTLSLAVMLGLRTSIGTTNTILERSQKEDLINRLNSYASIYDVENSGPIGEVAADTICNFKSEEQNSESKRDSILDMLRGDNLTGRLATVSRMIKEYKENKKASGTELARWLESYDFMAVEKYVFRPKGGPSTPPHQLSHTFKFKDYSPKAFAYIRRLNGINETEFLSSVCGNANYIEFVSNAKSGQFFFYSSDGKYMIKTMTSTESKFLRRILPHYFRHCVRFPNTLICKFLGMYRVKMYHLRRNVKFVVMNSVFDTDKFISSFYDLKGSTTGRDAKPGEYVKKDNDIRRQLPSAALHFDQTVKERLRAQIMEDCNFLKSMKIMDYSMLVGVHRIPQGRQEFNESFLTDHESSKSLLLDDTAYNGSFSPSEIYSSPISNRKVFRSAMKPDLERGTSEKSILVPKLNSLSYEDRHTATVHLDSPKNSGSSIDRFLEATSPSRSFSCSEGVVFDDDDYSYLEDCSSPLLHSDQRYSDDTKLNAGQFESGKYDRSAKDFSCTSSEILNKEVSTEQFYWPFHRFFNNKGDRRLQLSPFLVEDETGKNSNVESSSPFKDLPLFIKPISDRKDKGLLSTSVSSSENLLEHGALDKSDQVNNKIFYMGIIDVLQQFNLRKRIEAQLRIYQGDGWQDASCVHPDLYASRFLQFFDEITLAKSSIEPSGFVSTKAEHESNSDVSHEEISFVMVDGNNH